jgi:Zn-dependent protease with chaperone function
MAAPDHWPAELYDGVSPRPRTGSIAIEGDRCTLSLAEDPAAALALSHERIARHERVRDEVHIELQPSSRQTPAAKIVVRGAGFEEALHGFLSLTDPRLVAGVRRGLRRVPLWGWLLILAVTAPAVYFGIQSLFLAAHVLISIEAETALGEAVYEHLIEDWPLCEDEPLRAELQAMVDELSDPRSPYKCRVSVIRSPDVNALALPGGRILVLSGLLEKTSSPEAVLGVLAHEVAHVERRHGMKQLMRILGVSFFMSAAIGGGFEELELVEAASELAGVFLALRYTRDAEREADEVAAEKLQQRRRSVAGLIDFFEMVEKKIEPEDGAVKELLRWVGSHPLTSSRIAMLREALAKETFDARPWRIQDEDWARTAASCAAGGPEQAGAEPEQGK